jgi:hypothetical protein
MSKTCNFQELDIGDRFQFELISKTFLKTYVKTAKIYCKDESGSIFYVDENWNERVTRVGVDLPTIIKHTIEKQ